MTLACWCVVDLVVDVFSRRVIRFVSRNVVDVSGAYQIGNHQSQTLPFGRR